MVWPVCYHNIIIVVSFDSYLAANGTKTDVHLDLYH